MKAARDKIPARARAVAEKTLRRCDVEKKVSPMAIFTEELTLALQKEFDVGFRVGKNVGRLKAAKRTTLG